MSEHLTHCIHMYGVGIKCIYMCVEWVGGIRVCAVCQVFAIYTSVYRSVCYIHIVHTYICSGYEVCINVCRVYGGYTCVCSVSLVRCIYIECIYSQSHLGCHFRKLKAQSSNVSFAAFR